MKTKKILTLVIASLAGLLCAAGIYAYSLLGARYEYEDTRVEIPRGADSDSIRSILVGTLGKDFGGKVYRIWNLRGGKPSVARGSYLVDEGTTSLNLAKAIFNGRQTPVKFTFNNLRTISALASRVATKFETDSASFIAACDSLLGARGFAPAEYPAAFLPDTYSFYWTASPEYIVEKLFAIRQRFWNQERIEKARKLGLRPVEVATLATIVEEETNKADERPKVARLYLNRLERGMHLQADPTVKFALGDFGLRRITGEHLKVESPYNTYRVQGLPPGPIRIAERSAIDDVLNAPAHNYIYMCARPDFSGYHDFATDYSRHRINAARYHRALSARNI